MNKKEPKDVWTIMHDYYVTISKMIPFDRLTDEEKSTLDTIFSSNTLASIIVAQRQNYTIEKILNFAYSTYLAGLGYTGVDWRKNID